MIISKASYTRECGQELRVITKIGIRGKTLEATITARFLLCLGISSFPL